MPNWAAVKTWIYSLSQKMTFECFGLNKLKRRIGLLRRPMVFDKKHARKKPWTEDLFIKLIQ